MEDVLEAHRWPPASLCTEPKLDSRFESEQTTTLHVDRHAYLLLARRERLLRRSATRLQRVSQAVASRFESPSRYTLSLHFRCASE